MPDKEHFRKDRAVAVKTKKNDIGLEGHIAGVRV